MRKAIFFEKMRLIFPPKMISIHAKDFSVHENDHDLIEKKAERLLHLARDLSDESTKIRIEFELEARDKDLIGGTLTIALPHDTLRAEATAQKNPVAVMDILVEKIKTQIEKHKNK